MSLLCPLRRALVHIALVSWCWLAVAAPIASAQGTGEAADAEAAATAEEPAPEPAAEPTPQDELREQLSNFDRLRGEITAILQQVEAAGGDERLALAFQARDRWMDAMRIAHELARDLAAAEAAGLEVGDIRPQVQESLRTITKAIPGLMDRTAERLDELRKQRDTAEGEEVARIDSLIAKQFENLTVLERQYLDHLRDLETVGLDAADARSDLVDRVQSRAEDLSGRLQLAAAELEETRNRAAATPDDADRAEAVRVAKERLGRVAGSLKAAVATMGALDLDASRYNRLLIESTGEISNAIFDRRVAAGLLEQWSERAAAWARSNAPTVLFRVFLFALVLFLTGLAARITRRLVARGVNTSRARLTQLARHMVVNISGRIVWIFGALVAVSQLGIEIGPLLAGLGVAGFIIGFALQDTLGNFASGAMLLIYRPYDVGDLVEVAGGVFGNVSKQSLVSTTILTIDNQTLVIPNSKIWGDVIKNVTAQRRRRVDMKFGISYADDILHAEKVFLSILEEHPKVLADPAPNVRLHELGDSSVNFIVRPWVNTADYWDVYWDVTREVKLRLDREGISIPFPQRDVHFYPEARRSKRVPAEQADELVQKPAGARAGDADGEID
jgi:small conductance mechanosensitive channel